MQHIGSSIVLFRKLLPLWPFCLCYQYKADKKGFFFRTQEIHWHHSGICLENQNQCLCHSWPWSLAFAVLPNLFAKESEFQFYIITVLPWLLKSIQLFQDYIKAEQKYKICYDVDALNRELYLLKSSVMIWPKDKKQYTHKPVSHPWWIMPSYPLTGKILPSSTLNQ